MTSETDDSKLILYLHASAAFQYLNAGIEIGVFELLQKRKALTSLQIAEEVKLSLHATRILLFGLSALELIVREGELYENGRIISSVFARNEWELLCVMTKFQSNIVYLGLTDFVPSLREDRNVGLERIAGEGNTLYQRFSSNPAIEGIFFDYMDAYSDFAIKHLLENIDLSKSPKILDVGGGKGKMAIRIADHFPNVKLTLLDLPPIIEMAEPLIAKSGLLNRITLLPADMFADEFPNGQDCVLFIHQLVIWDNDEIKLLLQKAFDALNPNGQVVIFSSIADDTETGPLMAALDTAYFRAVAAGNGMIYPWKDYEKALVGIGYSEVRNIRCNSWTPHGIVVAHKPGN